MNINTAIGKAIKKLEETPKEMNSNKAIAAWLQACYLDLEKQQIIDAYTASFDNERLTSSEIYKIGEDYYNELAYK